MDGHRLPPDLAVRAPEALIGEEKLDWASDWAELDGSRRLERGMFVAQVPGDTMDWKIPDGSWCLFRRPPDGSRSGRILAVSHGDVDDPAYGGRFAVKQYFSEKTVGDDGSFRHARIELRLLSTNPGHEPIVLRPEHEDEVWVLGEFMEVLR